MDRSGAASIRFAKKHLAWFSYGPPRAGTSGSRTYDACVPPMVIVCRATLGPTASWSGQVLGFGSKRGALLLEIETRIR